MTPRFGGSKRRGANFDVNVVNWENQELRFTKVKSDMSESQLEILSETGGKRTAGGHLHSGRMKNHASRMLTLPRHPE